jgi:hypothetical protein
LFYFYRGRKTEKGERAAAAAAAGPSTGPLCGAVRSVKSQAPIVHIAALSKAYPRCMVARTHGRGTRRHTNAAQFLVCADSKQLDEKEREKKQGVFGSVAREIPQSFSSLLAGF